MSKKSLAMLLGLLVSVFGFACGGSKEAATAETTPVAEPTKSGKSAAQVEAKGYMDQAVMAEAEDDLATAFAYYAEAALVLDKSGEVIIERGEAHYLAGGVAHRMQKIDDAIIHYKAAVDIYLRFTGNAKIKAAVVLTNMGVAYKFIDDKPKARNCWSKALDIYKEAPEEFKNYNHMGKIEQNISDLDQGL